MVQKSESKESIKFNAFKSYSAQDRAVTTEDYKVKVNELYANAKSVSIGVVKITIHLFMVEFIFQ